MRTADSAWWRKDRYIPSARVRELPPEAEQRNVKVGCGLIKEQGSLTSFRQKKSVNNDDDDDDDDNDGRNHNNLKVQNLLKASPIPRNTPSACLTSQNLSETINLAGRHNFLN